MASRLAGCKAALGRVRQLTKGCSSVAHRRRLLCGGDLGEASVKARPRAVFAHVLLTAAMRLLTPIVASQSTERARRSASLRNGRPPRLFVQDDRPGCRSLNAGEASCQSDYRAQVEPTTLGDFVEGAARSSNQSFGQVDAEFFERVRPGPLSKRLGTPQAVASLLACVASPLSLAITGAALRVDGGVVKSVVRRGRFQRPSAIRANPADRKRSRMKSTNTFVFAGSNFLFE